MNLKSVVIIKILTNKNIFPRQNLLHTTLRKIHKYHSRLVSVWFRTIFKSFTVTLTLFPSSVLTRDLGAVCFAVLINCKYMQQCSLNAKNLIHKITHPKTKTVDIQFWECRICPNDVNLVPSKYIQKDRQRTKIRIIQNF
jgi:hypothetical protein